MAKDELTGNMPMEKMIYYFDDLSVDMNIDWKELRKAVNMTDAIFLH